MLEIIRNINNYLEYQYQFAVDRTPLYDKSKINIYPTLDDDWHIYPMYGFLRDKTTQKILRYANCKIFNPMIRLMLKQQSSIHILIKTLDVRMKIVINLIDKNIKDKKFKNVWIYHMQRLYAARLKACSAYYIDKVLPF